MSKANLAIRHPVGMRRVSDELAQTGSMKYAAKLHASLDPRRLTLLR